MTALTPEKLAAMRAAASAARDFVPPKSGEVFFATNDVLALLDMLRHAQEDVDLCAWERDRWRARYAEALARAEKAEARVAELTAGGGR